MDKMAVFTMKVTETYLREQDMEKFLAVFMDLLEVVGCEVVGEISYEEIEDEQEM
jgi:hypothetical protein